MLTLMRLAQVSEAYWCTYMQGTNAVYLPALHAPLEAPMVPATHLEYLGQATPLHRVTRTQTAQE